MPVTVVTEKTGAAVTDPQPELVYQVVFLLRQHSQQCGGTPCMQSVVYAELKTVILYLLPSLFLKSILFLDLYIKNMKALVCMGK